MLTVLRSRSAWLDTKIEQELSEDNAARRKRGVDELW